MPHGEQAQAARWAGTATAAPGLLAFTGAIGSAAPHAHAAVQVLLVLDGEVTLTDRHGHQRRTEAAIVPAGVRHELRAAPGAHGLLAYLDPAHPAARAAGVRIATAGDADTVSTWQAAARPPATGPATLPGVRCSIESAADTRGFPTALSRAVHHSIKRFYGFNGLMKHPLHQTLEMSAGVAPLILIGLPVDVASALALAVAVQLLLQHSNADYRVGALKYALALNEGHRFHHLKWAGVGDVNFGLFTLAWDHLLGTFSYDPARRFTSEHLGMAAKPDYPTAYLAQLAEPFRASGACETEPAGHATAQAPSRQRPKPGCMAGEG